MLKRTKKRKPAKSAVKHKVKRKSTVKRKVKKKSVKSASKVKKAPKRKVARKTKKVSPQNKKAMASNMKAQWETFKDLKAKTDKTIAKLKSDYEKNVKPEVLIDDIKMLGLLGGEAHYMRTELEKMESIAKKKKTRAKKSPTRRKAKK